MAKRTLDFESVPIGTLSEVTSSSCCGFGNVSCYLCLDPRQQGCQMHSAAVQYSMYTATEHDTCCCTDCWAETARRMEVAWSLW
jgi:hypothetical protein